MGGARTHLGHDASIRHVQMILLQLTAGLGGDRAQRGAPGPPPPRGDPGVWVPPTLRGPRHPGPPLHTPFLSQCCPAEVQDELVQGVRLLILLLFLLLLFLP